MELCGRTFRVLHVRHPVRVRSMIFLLVRLLLTRELRCIAMLVTGRDDIRLVQ